MTEYIIIETDVGMTIVQHEPGQDAAETAAEQGGFLVDPGPYHSYEEVYDAMLQIPIDSTEERFEE